MLVLGRKSNFFPIHNEIKQLVGLGGGGAAQPQEQIILISQSLHLLGFFPICNNIFPIIDQCRFFLYFWNRTWSITILMINLIIYQQMQNYRTICRQYLPVFCFDPDLSKQAQEVIFTPNLQTKLPSIIS